MCTHTCTHVKWHACKSRCGALDREFIKVNRTARTTFPPKLCEILPEFRTFILATPPFVLFCFFLFFLNQKKGSWTFQTLRRKSSDMQLLGNASISKQQPSPPSAVLLGWSSLICCLVSKDYWSKCSFKCSTIILLQKNTSDRFDSTPLIKSCEGQFGNCQQPDVLFKVY